MMSTWNMTYMQSFEEADVAVALDNIRQSGGSVMDAAVIKMAAGKDADPYLDKIRSRMGDAALADELAEKIWAKH